MNVNQLMISPALFCRSTDCLSSVVLRMGEVDVDSLPVVDAAGRFLGVITERDICNAAVTQGKPLVDIHVSVVMSREAQTCRSTDSQLYAAKIMRESEVRWLPVVDAEGCLAGTLSMNDLERVARSPYA